MSYFKLGDSLYAYDGATGFTVKYGKDGWGLANITYAYIIGLQAEGADVPMLTHAEAMSLTGGADPSDFIKAYCESIEL